MIQKIGAGNESQRAFLQLQYCKRIYFSPTLIDQEDIAVYRVISIILLLAMFTGCSESGPPVAPVDGVVTFQGEPVAYAKVMFFAQNVEGAGIGFALTDAEGKFTEVLTGGTRKGAVVGSHFVTVTEDWPPGEEIPMDSMGMELEPPRGPWGQKYRDSTDPAIKVEVVADQDNHFEFDLSE